MPNRADSDQLASSEANWSGSTLFVNAGYIPAQQNQDLEPAINSFSTEHSKAVPLLQFFFVFALVGSYVAFVLSLFVPHLFFFWCPRKNCASCDSWVSSLIFFYIERRLCRIYIEYISHRLSSTRYCYKKLLLPDRYATAPLAFPHHCKEWRSHIFQQLGDSEGSSWANKAKPPQ